MGRSDVEVEKVWAPTLAEIHAKAHAYLDTVDTIVVQALTRDIGNFEMDEYLTKLYEAVDMCASKANKVVVSQIVRRSDTSRVPDIERKVSYANASIKVRYFNNPKVVLCEHDNLDDSKYRKPDKLHLTEFGTSRYANNLKYGIADALNITIEKKKRTMDRNTDHNTNRDNEYRGTRWERRNQRWKYERGVPFRSRWDEDY